MAWMQNLHTGLHLFLELAQFSVTLEVGWESKKSDGWGPFDHMGWGGAQSLQAHSMFIRLA